MECCSPREPYHAETSCWSAVGCGAAEQQLAEAHELGDTSARYVMVLDDSLVIDGEHEGNDALGGANGKWFPRTTVRILELDAKGNVIMTTSKGENFFLKPNGDMAFVK